MGAECSQSQDEAEDSYQKETKDPSLHTGALAETERTIPEQVDEDAEPRMALALPPAQAAVIFSLVCSYCCTCANELG